MNIVFETDWLASRPVFYNEKTGAISHSIRDVIDFNNIELHPEGFNNYLEFGYSVFGQTPLKNVKFLDACSRISRDESGKLHIEKLPDPLDATLDTTPSKPEEILKLIQDRVQDWEKTVSGPIILPLSGGYDSRLLASMIFDRSRLQAFTYGTSDDQRHSCEVIRAEEVSKRLNIPWNFIPLTHVQQYFSDWNKLFGPAVHAHGMYHFDFFKQVKSTAPPQASAFLSGIIGDLWSGHVQFKHIDSEKDLVNLARHHGVTANHQASLLTSDRALRTAYFEKYKDVINNTFHQRILFARLKLVLLTYLYQVPESFGFKPWSPFLDYDIAVGMLNLPEKSLAHRSWQTDYFASKSLDVESQKMPCVAANTLDLQIIQEGTLQPLDENILGQAVDPAYVRKINTDMMRSAEKLHSAKKLQDLLSRFRLYGIFRRLGMKELYGKHSRIAQSYAAYCILKPIELILKEKK